MRIIKDFRNIMRTNPGNLPYLFSRKNTRNFLQKLNIFYEIIGKF